MSHAKTNLGRAFWALLQKHPDASLLWMDEPLEAWTAARFQNLLVCLAVGLQEQGLTPGQRLLLATQPCAESLALAMAAWMVGAVTIHVAPETPEAFLADALARMKAAWMIVDAPQTLAMLELAHGPSVKDAQVILLSGAPAQPVARVISYDDLEKQGRKKKDLRLNALAQAMMAVPRDARAAILYWAEGQELKAAALSHEELEAAFTPLPVSWTLSAQDKALVLAPLTSRAGLLATLRLLAQRVPLAFPTPQGAALPVARKVAPSLLVADGEATERFLEEADDALQSRGLHSTLRRGLGWIERQTRHAAQDPAQHVAHRIEGWLERDLAASLVRTAGGELRLLWALGPLHDDARQLLARTRVRLVQDA